ncbi:MAG: WXG100 family type VII secretion target [Micrococcales bacterium]|nr:WXG100 family type VII secretion target [Micrococcales bacterium]
MFYIKGQTVIDLGEYLAGQSGGVQTDLDALDTKVRLVLGQWDGEAQAAYNAAQLDWTQKMTNLRTCLSNIGNSLEGIVGMYQAADRQGANLF